MIQVENISKTYRSKTGSTVSALSKYNIQIKAGEFVTLSGPSGSGKSTLLSIIGGLLNPDQGSVRVAGKELTQMRDSTRIKWRAETIGFVFQRFHLLPYLSVRENILSGAIGTPDQKAASTAKTEALMHALGMTSRADHLPEELSVGEMQRTALARALVNEPKVLLADEPTGNLDPQNAQIVLNTFAQYAESGGTVLMVSHNPSDTARASRQLSIAGGLG